MTQPECVGVWVLLVSKQGSQHVCKTPTLAPQAAAWLGLSAILRPASLRPTRASSLHPACILHPAPADPIGAWIDAGMAEVRPDISNAAYAASHSFVADWRTHRVWDYLNGSLWKFIPSDERVLDAQVRRAAQIQNSVIQL